LAVSADNLAPQPLTVAEGSAGGGFNARVMLWVVGAAILSFVGYLFLAAYAPDMKRGEDGRGHALSGSAIGYSALVALRDELGRSPNLIRTKTGLENNRLVVVTPEFRTSNEALESLLKERGDRPTLVILPKRQTQANPLHPGWVTGRKIADPYSVEQIALPAAKIKIIQTRATAPRAFSSDWSPTVTFAKGAVVQTMAGDVLVPYLTDEAGNILLAGVRRAKADNEDVDDEDYTPLYILSDPDVMNNLGVGNAKIAFAASGILDGLSTDKTKEVEFDVTLNGFEASKGLLKLAFEPPFLALSLCLFVAALMALANGLMRFGPPLQEQRAVAPGKGALVANTADLLRLAGLEHEIGGRYGALTRDVAANALGLPQSMSAEAVTQRLDKISRDGLTYSELARRAEGAGNSQDMLAAARALFQWRKERTG
jgi:hypothetical protein